MKEYKIYAIIKEEDKKNLFANTLDRYCFKLSALESQSEAARTLAIKDISLETQISILKDLMANHNQVMLILETLLENYNFFLSLEEPTNIEQNQPDEPPMPVPTDSHAALDQAVKLRKFMDDLQKRKEELDEED